MPTLLEELRDAAFRGDTAKVVTLLRENIDLNTPLPNGDRLLLSVAGMGDARLTITKLLVANGAEVDFRDSRGETVLERIQRPPYCDNDATIQFLRSPNAAGSSDYRPWWKFW